MKYILISICQFVALASFGQAALQWEHHTEDLLPDFYATGVEAVSEETFLLSGYTINTENSDYMVTMVNLQQEIIWQATYGGMKEEQLFSVHPTEDGGFLLGGSSESSISGDKSEESRGIKDFWLVKIDANGNPLWDKTYGGESYDVLYDIASFPDGNFLLAGTSSSKASNEKTENPKGSSDYWIVKITPSGEVLWDKTVGGSRGESLKSVAVDSNGEILLNGVSDSGISGDKSVPDVEFSNGGIWVVKLDHEGEKLWDKIIGGPYESAPGGVLSTKSDHFIVAGAYFSRGVLGNNSGNHDHILTELDANGEIVWQVTRGGDRFDMVTELFMDADQNFIVCGRSDSDASGAKSEDNIGIDTEPIGGFRPINTWLYKMSPDGKKIWDKTVRGGRRANPTYVMGTVLDTGKIILTGGYTQLLQETKVKIKGFRLVNAEKDQDIGWLNDKDLLEKSAMGNPDMNVRAIPYPIKVDSIVFEMTGPVERFTTENFWPYTLFGDTKKSEGWDYAGRKLRTGNRYILKATPYLDSIVGTPKRIEFRVTDNFMVGPIEIISYDPRWLYDSYLEEGMTLEGEFTLEPEIHPANLPGLSVLFELTGPENHTQLEKGAPYVLYGDQWEYHQDPSKTRRSLPPGEYTLTITPYTYEFAGDSRTVNFKVSAGDDETAATRVHVYPNPSKGRIYLENLQSQAGLMEILDHTGNLHWKKTITGNEIKEVDLSTMKKGIYLLKINQGNEVITRRIVLE